MNIQEHLEKAMEFKGFHSCYVHAESKNGKCLSFATGDTLDIMLICIETMVKSMREANIPEHIAFQMLYDKLKETDNAR